MEFSQIALLLVAAAVSASIAKLFKQPLLIGYLFAGFVLSLLGLVENVEVFSGLGQVGVALLLFLVGIEMNLSELPTIGKVAALAGLGQIIFTSVLGYILSVILGYPPLASLYFAVALSFSSTIIIVKLLSEKKELGSLYGKISVGILLIQDLVAIIILMFLAGMRQEAIGLNDILLIIFKGSLLIIATWILSKKIIPTLFDRFLAKSSELLFISSLAWALGVAAFVGGPLGFTLEIGGFLAGLSLSSLPEHLQIASRTRPVRDFFLTIFFLLLGTQLVISNAGVILVPALIFSIFVLIGHPIIVMVILGFLGFTKRTSYLSGVTLAQISEFSLILMSVGASLGHVTGANVATVLIVGVVTMTMSTYLIMGAERIYKPVEKYLKIFQRKNPKESAVNVERSYENHVVLVGADRTGKTIIKYLKKKGYTFVVVDFNPKVFKELTAEGTPCIFGDMSDPEIYDQAMMERSRLVISTTSNLSANLYLLENIKALRNRPISMFTTTERADGIRLYEKGADYVMVPHSIAGEYIRHILSTYGLSDERIKKLGKANFNRLMTQ